MKDELMETYFFCPTQLQGDPELFSKFGHLGKEFILVCTKINDKDWIDTVICLN